MADEPKRPGGFAKPGWQGEHDVLPKGYAPGERESTSVETREPQTYDSVTDAQIRKPSSERQAELEASRRFSEGKLNPGDNDSLLPGPRGSIDGPFGAIPSPSDRPPLTAQRFFQDGQSGSKVKSKSDRLSDINAKVTSSPGTSLPGFDAGGGVGAARQRYAAYSPGTSAVGPQIGRSAPRSGEPGAVPPGVTRTPAPSAGSSPSPTAQPGPSDLIMPFARGRVTSEMGPRGGRQHAGIDLAGTRGQPVWVTSNQRVISAGPAGGYGNLVRTVDEQGREHRYGHLDSIKVRPGQSLKQGEQLGTLGSTGHSTGPHVHYEIREGGRAINPRPHLLQPGQNAWDYTGRGEPGQRGSSLDPGPGATIAPPLASDGDPSFLGQRGPASLRYNNPGAQYPGPVARQFGSIGTQTIGGGHKIAVFPTAVHGAAAQFALLQRSYTGLTLSQAIHKWSGGNSSGAYTASVARETGLSPNTVLTRKHLADPRIAIPLAKAMARIEMGRAYPLTDSQWRRAYDMSGIGPRATPKRSTWQGEHDTQQARQRTDWQGEHDSPAAPEEKKAEPSPAAPPPASQPAPTPGRPPAERGDEVIRPAPVPTVPMPTPTPLIRPDQRDRPIPARHEEPAYRGVISKEARLAAINEYIAALPDGEFNEDDDMLRQVITDLVDEVIELRRESAELHRRMSNVIRPARVTQLDPKKGVVKLTFATDDDGEDVETGWIRWGAPMGDIKLWMPPKPDSKKGAKDGEQVILISPGGEIGMLSWAQPGGFTTKNKKNHDKAKELKLNVGKDTELTITEKGFFFKGEIIDMQSKTNRRKSDKIIDEGGRIDHNKKNSPNDPTTPDGPLDQADPGVPPASTEGVPTS